MKQDYAKEMLELPDGRLLCFGRFGDTQGRPVLFLHGFPGSRTQAAMVSEQAKNKQVCLIAPDRPGFGFSEFHSARELSNTCVDFIYLMKHLGYKKFPVVGVSCGGAYALACAHDFPHQITSVGLLAGMGPMDIPAIRNGQLKILTLLFWLAKKHAVFSSPLLVLDSLMFRKDPDKAVRLLSRMLSQPDRELLHRNVRVKKLFGKSLSEAYQQGLQGALLEAHIIGSRRPYMLRNITQPVEVFQGQHDNHVPPTMGRYIANEVQHGRLHFNEHAGHLSIVVSEIESCLELMLRS